MKMLLIALFTFVSATSYAHSERRNYAFNQMGSCMKLIDGKPSYFFVDDSLCKHDDDHGFTSFGTCVKVTFDHKATYFTTSDDLCDGEDDYAFNSLGTCVKATLDKKLTYFVVSEDHCK